MDSIFAQLSKLATELPLPGKIVAVLLLVLLIWFGIRYFGAGVLQRIRLNTAVKRIRSLASKTPADFAKVFERDMRLSHLWQEYQGTLHAQRELDAKTGQYVVMRHRSTVPAEVIFTREVLADSVVAADFFRHLPGIFTGLGIIGTFVGLIGGINAFKVTDNNQAVRDGLNALLHDVSQAFSVSFFAIAFAMLVTLVEKLQISGLYKKIEELCQAIDAAFEAGAGADYLSRLVTSSESVEKETKILKDSLVTELKQVLEGLTERQIQQATINADAIAGRIVAGMNEGLRDPLNTIGEAVKSVGGNQTDAVNKLIVDTMSAMTAQMKDLFGDQISGINRMQQETIAALQNSLGRLDEFTAKMSQSGTSATELMATKISEAIADMEARQRAINAELTKAVANMGSSVSDSQAETSRKTQEAVAAMSASVSEMVRTLQALVEDASANEQRRSNTLTEHAQTTQAALSASMDSTVKQVADVGQAIQQAVERMEQVTTGAIMRMNEGANTLYIAASDFAKAGEKTSETLTKANALTQQLGTAAAALTGSSNTLTAAVSEYKTVRDEVSRLVSELRATVDSAKTEASLTQDILARINSATNGLIAAEKSADEYLGRVSGVLEEAHGAFAKNVTDTLRKANSDFHQHLTSATKMLGDTIDALTEHLESLPPRR